MSNFIGTSKLITHYASLITVSMRLDLFLKVSRLCPRRTLAQELCGARFALLNGRPAKSAHAVKAGDEMPIRRRDLHTIAHVRKAPATRDVSRRDSDQLVAL